MSSAALIVLFGVFLGAILRAFFAASPRRSFGTRLGPRGGARPNKTWEMLLFLMLSLLLLTNSQSKAVAVQIGDSKR